MSSPAALGVTWAGSARGAGLGHCLPHLPGPSESEDQDTPAVWLCRVSSDRYSVKREVDLWDLQPSILQLPGWFSFHTFWVMLIKTCSRVGQAVWEVETPGTMEFTDPGLNPSPAT